METRVVNASYPFKLDLSPYAVLEYARRKGFQLYVYEIPKRYSALLLASVRVYGIYREVTEAEIDEIFQRGDAVFLTYWLEPLKPIRRKKHFFIATDLSKRFWPHKIDPSDPVLIEVVRDLGGKANALWADLKIVEGSINALREWVAMER